MAHLRYLAHNGEQATISLPMQTGATANLSWFAIASVAAKTRIQADVEQLNAVLLDQTGDHLIYGERGQPVTAQPVILVVIMQESRQPAKASNRPAPRRATLLFHRSRREWLVVADGRTSLLVDGEPSPLLKIVRDGMKLQLGELSLTFSEVDRVSATAALIKSKNCPYCGDPFAPEETLITCPSCGTVQHAACWDEYGGRCSGPAGCHYGLKVSHQ